MAKYMGFDKLAARLEAEGKSPASAKAISASVGRRKYGATTFNSHAAKGKKLRGVKPRAY